MGRNKIFTVLLAIVFLGAAIGAISLIVIVNNLPQIVTVTDYKPMVVSKVYDKNGEEIGEFKRQKRIVIPYEEIPPMMINAFVAAEDRMFFEHDGINYAAIIKAQMENIMAGRIVRGASTITQQVAKTLLLSPEKTYTRKIREAILAKRMEANLSKKEILYLYLNQIYLGGGAYGVEAAAKTYFRKSAKDLELKEIALIAGLPPAPSRYSPTINPKSAKTRQQYVLRGMLEEGFINQEQHDQALSEDVAVYTRLDLKERAPYFVESIRTYLVETIGESKVLDKGIKVYTGLDLQKQLAAQEELRQGLRELDKRQGFRGPIQNLQQPEEITKFLAKVKENAVNKFNPIRLIHKDGSITKVSKLGDELVSQQEIEKEEPKLPPYFKLGDIVEGIVTQVDDKWGLVYIRFAGQKGLIDMDSMKWARTPDPNVASWSAEIAKPSEALKQGDIIQIKLINNNFASQKIREKLRNLKKIKRKNYVRPAELPDFDEYLHLELEQEPKAEAALLSIDNNSHEIVAMVGGYDFKKSEFNRTYQAARQTGSSFKPLVYLGALDKGYTPSTTITDSPIVYEEKIETDLNDDGQIDEEQTRKWKPRNYSEKFRGDVLFRKALIKSMNIPTIKIEQEIGVPWVADYAKRLGIFSPLNMDFTLGLGSSSVTLYEITKVFAQIARLGKKIRPVLIKKVTDAKGEVLLENISLDERFKEEIAKLDEEFELKRAAFFEKQKALKETEEILPEALEKENQDTAKVSNPPTVLQKETQSETLISTRKKLRRPDFYFTDPEQLVSPQTSYLMASLLMGVVQEGTGRRAKALGRPTGGKTGTTNGFFDAWFVGFTEQMSTGVWVGFDTEKSLGKGESGGKAALPIWVEYMKTAHEGLPVKSLKTPKKIVFANIDGENGKLANASSNEVVRQAFLEGTEPGVLRDTGAEEEEENEFFKDDYN